MSVVIPSARPSAHTTGPDVFRVEGGSAPVAVATARRLAGAGERLEGGRADLVVPLGQALLTTRAPVRHAQGGGRRVWPRTARQQSSARVRGCVGGRTRLADGAEGQAVGHGHTHIALDRLQAARTRARHVTLAAPAISWQRRPRPMANDLRVRDSTWQRRPRPMANDLRVRDSTHALHAPVGAADFDRAGAGPETH